MAYRESLQKAQLKFDIAFHLLTVSFPVIKDPKLLMVIIDNIFSSLEYSMDTVLKYERELRLVPVYGDSFKAKFNLFRLKCVKRNNVPHSVVDTMMDLNKLIDLHRKSPMEFPRGGNYVICSEDYHLRTVSTKEIRIFLDEAKKFIDIAQDLIESH